MTEHGGDQASESGINALAGEAAACRRTHDRFGRIGVRLSLVPWLYVAYSLIFSPG